MKEIDIKYRIVPKMISGYEVLFGTILPERNTENRTLYEVFDIIDDDYSVLSELEDFQREYIFNQINRLKMEYSFSLWNQVKKRIKRTFYCCKCDSATVESLCFKCLGCVDVYYYIYTNVRCSPKGVYYVAVENEENNIIFDCYKTSGGRLISANNFSYYNSIDTIVSSKKRKVICVRNKNRTYKEENV